MLHLSGLHAGTCASAMVLVLLQSVGASQTPGLLIYAVIPVLLWLGCQRLAGCIVCIMNDS